MLDPGAPERKEMLFLAPRKVEDERWSGERAPLPSDGGMRRVLGPVPRDRAGDPVPQGHPGAKAEELLGA